MPRFSATGAAVALFLINAFIVPELFFVEYTTQMGSIEAAYISLSRYITENWTDLTWFPLWYGGIPFQNAYPPLLHVTVAVAADAMNLTAARAHHFVTALFYCFGPVSLFWMALRLSRDLAGSFLSGLLYSVVSLSAFLPAVRHDIGSIFHARRLQALSHYGEGPHIASMALLPVAIVCLDLAFKRRKPVLFLLAGISLAAVVLTNWLGGFALAAAVASYLLARRTTLKGWLAAATLGIYAYALAAPWIPPTTLLAIRTNAQRIGGPFHMGSMHLLYAAIFILMLAALHILLIRVRASRVLHFSTLFFLFMGGVTLSAEWFGLFLVPQPQRYHLEMEMALAPGLVFGARALLSGRPLIILRAALVLLLACSAAQMLHYRRYARSLLRPLDITRTTEHKIARWFEEHMAGKRVMAPGSTSFWMNAFTDTPQIGGGFDQGITNQQLPVAQFQIYSGMAAGDAEGKVAIAWLKALGVHAVAIGGPESGEYYKPFANPRKFESLLPEVWRDGDDRIYAIPQRSTSLARVVRKEQLVQRPPPTGAIVDTLATYIAALDDAAFPHADWIWRNRHSATIAAKLERHHVLSIQIAYHPGWTATANGRNVRIGGDAIGQMAIEPACDGECKVELLFTGGTEAAAARATSYIALIGGLAWTGISFRKRTAKLS